MGQQKYDNYDDTNYQRDDYFFERANDEQYIEEINNNIEIKKRKKGNLLKVGIAALLVTGLAFFGVNGPSIIKPEVDPPVRLPITNTGTFELYGNKEKVVDGITYYINSDFYDYNEEDEDDSYHGYSLTDDFYPYLSIYTFFEWDMNKDSFEDKQYAQQYIDAFTSYDEDIYNLNYDFVDLQDRTCVVIDYMKNSEYYKNDLAQHYIIMPSEKKALIIDLEYEGGNDYTFNEDQFIQNIEFED